MICDNPAMSFKSSHPQSLGVYSSYQDNALYLETLYNTVDVWMRARKPVTMVSYDGIHNVS